MTEVDDPECSWKGDGIAYDRVTPALYSAFRDCADILQCPITGERLIAGEDGWSSPDGQRYYPVDQGIPQLFVPVDPTVSDRDVTEMVKAFYEETPFPNYDDIDARETLVTKARQGRFAAALNEQLPEAAIVLEAGCGTGQLTNFLGLSWKRRVLGGDVCLNSLRLANGFRERFRISNAAFLQMNLFGRPFVTTASMSSSPTGCSTTPRMPTEASRACFAKLNPAATF